MGALSTREARRAPTPADGRAPSFAPLPSEEEEEEEEEVVVVVVVVVSRLARRRRSLGSGDDLPGDTC